MGVVLVVVDPPVLGEEPGLQQGEEELLIEQLVPQPAVERFDVGVLPW